MSATVYHPPLVRSQVLRWAGGICGVALFVIWATLVTFEVTWQAPQAWPVGLYLQGAALAVVFAGYAVGWRRELLGAALIGLGALAYMVVTFTDTELLPNPAIAWFLTPGVLYLLARYLERTEHGPRLA